MPENLSILPPIKAWLVVAVAAAVFLAPFWRVRPRGWPPQRRRLLGWGGAHVAAAFVVLWFMPLVIYPFVDPEVLGRWFFRGDADPAIVRNLSLALAGTLALPLQLLAWRGLLATVDAHPVPAITPRATLREVRVGYLTWLVVTPVVYIVGLAALLVYSKLGGQSDEHPILKLTQAPVVSPAAHAGLLLLVLAEALIAAPVREELLFRGILLPWLADRPWGGDVSLVLAAIVGVALRPPMDQPWTSPVAIASRFGPAFLVLAITPLARPLANWRPLRRLLPIHDDVARVQAIRAIVGSAALFACVHSNVWPTPIPLALLALALGWLALRTQSVVAPIVVHILFNTVAFVEIALGSTATP
jgi:membrane protease YdiL (CAAX protease family)